MYSVLEQFKSQCLIDSVDNLSFNIGRLKHDLEYLESVNGKFKGKWDNEISLIKEKIHILTTVLNVKKTNFESVKISLPNETFKYYIILTDIISNKTLYYSENNGLQPLINDNCENFIFLKDAEEKAIKLKNQFGNCLISIIKVSTKQELIKSII